MKEIRVLALLFALVYSEPLWARQSGGDVVGGAGDTAVEAVDRGTGLSLGASKAGYHLFHPTPRSFRRPLSADRPDITESPYTVDAGAVQFELSFFGYSFNDAAGVEADTFSVLPTNFKIGTTNSTDIQFIWTPYTRVDRDPGEADDGAGDLQIRFKMNLWGNDDGPTALGVLPFITLPTGADGISADEVEGGFAVPFAADLEPLGLSGFSLGAQVEFAFERNEADDGYDTRFTHTTVIGYAFTDRFGGYLEFVGSTVIDTGGGYSPRLSFGGTYLLNDNTQLDAGVLLGLDDDSTDDVAVFAGLTLRY